MAKSNPVVPGMRDAIEGRRKAERLSIDDFADASGLTRQGLMDVRNGLEKAYQERLLDGVAVALRWPHDWYRRLLAGEDWRAFPDVEHPPHAASVRGRLSRLEERLDELAQAVLERGLAPPE